MLIACIAKSTCATGGEPSTWFLPDALVEQITSKERHSPKKQRQHKKKNVKAKHLKSKKLKNHEGEKENK